MVQLPVSRHSDVLCRSKSFEAHGGILYRGFARFLSKELSDIIIRHYGIVGHGEQWCFATKGVWSNRPQIPKVMKKNGWTTKSVYGKRGKSLRHPCWRMILAGEDGLSSTAEIQQ